MGNGISNFFDAHSVHVFFFYGLAFSAMGLALLLESRKTSALSLGRSMQLMGIFGLLHGAHEFVEMFVLISGQPLTLTGEALRVCLLVASFLPLLSFGLQNLPPGDRAPGFTQRMTVLAIVAFGMQVVLVRVTYQPTPAEWVRGIDVLSRYALAIPGAAFAGLGLLRQRRLLREQQLDMFGRDLAIAAIAMVWYGVIGQAFPGESIIFPSMYINAGLFREWMGFPVQALRGGMAGVIALALIRALRAFEEEATRRLETARRAEHELQLAARELSLLYEASSLLAEKYDLDTLARTVLERIVRIIDPIKKGMIAIMPVQAGDVEHIVSFGYSSGLRHEVRRRWLGVCLQHHMGDPLEDELCWFDSDEQDVSVAVAGYTGGMSGQSVAIRRAILPLHTNQRTVGAIMLETDAQGPYLSLMETPTIVALTRQLAVAIDNARLVLQLRQREARRSELLQRATAAQEAERKRIARELHDETGQALTALAVGLKGTSKLIARDTALATEQVDRLQAVSTHALGELRHMISNLRPSHLDDMGLVAALRWYTEEVNRRSPAEICFELLGDVVRLSPEAETTLFRIAQESLNNVVRHAQAYHSTVRLNFMPGGVCLCVQDDGQGFDASDVFRPYRSGAWGLAGIQERALLAGGELSIKSTPGEGTLIRVRVPFGPGEEHCNDYDTRCDCG